MKEHPPVEKPLATRPTHSGVAKIDFSRNAGFGFEGQLFLAEFGSGTPVTGPGAVDAGCMVARLDPRTGEAQPFFGLKREAFGPAGYEHAATPGPRRPVDVRFSPQGDALYVADFDAMAAYPAGAGPVVRTFPGSGVLWRVSRQGASAARPPAGLSMLPVGGR